MARAAKLDELGLELRNFGALNELAVVGHPRHGVVDRVPEPAPLRRHVDQWD
jgi:hypothetical protein